MPERVEPCLAQLASKPLAGDDWTYEVEWDGYRLAIHIEPGSRASFTALYLSTTHAHQ